MRPSGKTTLLEQVRRLFTDRRELTAAACSTRAPRSASAWRAPNPPPAALAGACFSLVGLTALRGQLGERWPELSARVHDLAEAVIQRHLTRGDVFDAHGEDGYVVLFARLSEAQAAFKCRVIAKEIAAKLLGADWVGRSTDGVVFELPEAAVDAPAFELALNAAIARGRQVISTSMETPVASPQSARRSAEPSGSRASSLRSVLLAPIARNRGQAGYTPIWEFGVEALLRFRFRSAPQAGRPSILEDAKADIAALTQVLFDAGRLLQAGRRLPVICPVRLETILRDGWRSQIDRMLRGAPPAVRKLVTLEVVIAAETEAGWLGSLERAWRVLPGRPAACVPLRASAIPPVRSDVVQHLNLALPDTFSATKSGIDAMGAFVQTAERVGMTCGVLGLRTRAAALAATAVGFRQLAGPVIHPDIAALGQAIHFDLKSLYQDLLPPSARSG